MSAYGNIDSAFGGLKDGLGGRVETFRAAEAIAFGKPVFGYKGDALNAYGFKKDVAKLVYSTDFVASNSTIVTVNGVATAAVVYDTSHLATITAIKNAIAGLTGVEAVLDASDTDKRTILIRVKGATASVDSATTGGTGQPTDTVTYGSGQVFLGFALFTQKESVGIANYAVGDVMNVLSQDGRLWTPIAAAVKANSPAYVADAGSISNAGTLLNARIRSTAASGLALVEPDGQYDLTYAGSF